MLNDWHQPSLSLCGWLVSERPNCAFGRRLAPGDIIPDFNFIWANRARFSNPAPALGRCWDRRRRGRLRFPWPVRQGRGQTAAGPQCPPRPPQPERICRLGRELVRSGPHGRRHRDPGRAGRPDVRRHATSDPPPVIQQDQWRIGRWGRRRSNLPAAEGRISFRKNSVG